MSGPYDPAVGKDEISIRLHFAGGGSATGCIFLFPAEEPDAILWRRVLAFLEEPPFFPFRDEADGAIRFVNTVAIDRIRLLTMDEGDVDPTPYFTSIERAIVVLSDGEEVEGRVFVESPPPRTRLSDHLKMARPFLHLGREDEDGASADLFINKRFIRSVRPIGAAPAGP